MRILHLADRFGWCDGCARHIFFLLREQERSHEILLLAGAGDGGELAASEGIRIEFLPGILHAGRSPAAFPRGALRLWRAARRFRPDLIHAHHFYAANLARVNPFLGRTPLVLTVHANIPHAGILPHYPGDRVIAVSGSTREHILARHPELAGRIRHIPYGSVFLDRFREESAGREDVRALRERRGTEIAMLFAGRLVAEKGIDDLLEAAKGLSERERILLIVAGEGDRAGAVREAAAAAPDTVYLETVRDLEPVMQCVDIVVLPSRAGEGLPMILIEAGLAGKCVIASSLSGVPELIREGETGLLVRPGDVEGLRAALARAAGDGELRRRLGENLRDLVRREHGVEKMAARVEAVYAELVPPAKGDAER